MVDWSKLPDLAAVAALTCAFASVARQGQTSTSRHWLTGWVLIAVHFAAFIFQSTPGVLGTVAADIGYASLAGAGVLFMWASVPYRIERSSQWMLASLLTTNGLYAILLGLNQPAPWALNTAAVLFGAAPLAIALGARRDSLMFCAGCWSALYCLLSVFLLAFQNRPGNGLILAAKLPSLCGLLRLLHSRLV